MTTATATRRQLTWARRRRAVGKFWGDYRQNRAGLFGLAVLAVFVLSALLVPWIVGEDALSVTRPAGEPLQPPSGEFWLGTDRSGRGAWVSPARSSRAFPPAGTAAMALRYSASTPSWSAT